mmetsp:Transcript_114662/g.320403  ORF Transcript_114662/g.320403 Transcript_114662/m.320403 type:complete len:426 (-) Transcript_114662:231-1508(-)
MYKLVSVPSWLAFHILLEALLLLKAVVVAIFGRGAVSLKCEGVRQQSAPVQLKASASSAEHGEDLQAVGGGGAERKSCPATGEAPLAEPPQKAESDAELGDAAADDNSQDGASPIASQVLSLRLMRLRGGKSGDTAKLTQESFALAVQQARGRHQGVRFSVLREARPPTDLVLSLAVLGPAEAVEVACDDLRAAPELAADAAAEVEAEHVEHFFALHFTMRETWDLPQDDEVVDASIEDDWVDLGAEGGGVAAAVGVGHDEKVVGTATPCHAMGALLGKRVQEVLRDSRDLFLFMDENSFAEWGRDALRVDIVGRLASSAWQDAARVVLACEAHRAYLSRRYDAVFWCPEPLKLQLEDQVSSACRHWKGERATLGGGVGVSGTGITGFEDLAANVTAVLLGDEPPGWHRLEWTPDGAGAVPFETY